MDQHRNAKLAVLWVDALVKSEREDIPEVLSQHFDVRQQNRPAPADLVVPAGTAAVFINCDYPDRKALRFAVDLKRLHPSVMMIVLTVQHSEALAVWAFRSRMSDYLVKPVVAADLLRVVRLVTDAWRLRTGQDGREVGSLPPALPAEAQDSARPGRHSLLPAIYYVRRHYGEKISLEVAAARCGLKPTQLTRLFHRTYGLTFRDYVVRYRLREARRLLRDPGAKVAEVAEIVGFNDFSYFSRMFKRYFGLQPSEHRGTTPMPPGEGINAESTAQMLHLPPVP